jgi:hypothetical protein
MEKFDWTFIAALLSVAFGWFLNELGQWFRTRKEDRKIKKQVLFYLLETHFTFNKLDTAEITNLLTTKVLERIPKNEQTDEAKQFINHLYTGIIEEFVEDKVADSLEETEEHYTKSISELSKLDPITAYRLNGKNKIFQVFELLHDYYDEVKEKFPNEPGLNEHIELTVQTIKPELIKDAISDLEDEIKGIAFTINLWTWFRAKKTITKIKSKVRKDDEKKIDELLDLVMPRTTI